MQYISPFHFIDPAVTGADSRKNVLLARKKMLAELELNDGHSIEINGQQLSKDDIIRFFDEVLQSPDLSYHLAVYQDKILLQFLEHKVLEKKQSFAANPLYEDAQFINWIGLYYLHAFIAYAIRCKRELKEEEWETLMNNPLLMNSYQRETAWERLEKNARADIQQMENLYHKGITNKDIATVQQLCNPRHLKMLLQLPEDRFTSVRDDMAFAMMQVCIVIFNYYDRKWAIVSIKNAYKLAVSQRLKDDVHNKRLEMQAIHAKNRWRFLNINFNFFQWSKSRLILLGALIVLRAAWSFTDGGSKSIGYPVLTPIVRKYRPVQRPDSTADSATIHSPASTIQK